MRRWLRIILFLIVAAGIIHYFYPWWFTAENIPISDDFPAFIDFHINGTKAENTGEKWEALLYQINEHKVLCNRIVFMAMVRLTGTVDFKLLSFI